MKVEIKKRRPKGFVADDVTAAVVTIKPADAVPIASLLSHAVRADISYSPEVRRAALKILYQLAAVVEGLDGDADTYLRDGETLVEEKLRARLNAEYDRVRKEMDPGYGVEEPSRG